MRTIPTHRYRLMRSAPRRKSTYDIFDGTLQKTQIWLNELMTALDWENHPHKAYLALRTVLHALRDRLTVEEAVQLGAQLPMLVRGFSTKAGRSKENPARSGTRRIFSRTSKTLLKKMSPFGRKASRGRFSRCWRAIPVKVK